MSNFSIFYDARSPNMAMSRDPKIKFRKKNYFFLILHLIFGKVTKFLVKSSLLQKLSGKNLTGGGGGMENTPCAFRVKADSHEGLHIAVYQYEYEF